MMSLLCARLAALVALTLLQASVVRSATLEADVEQEGVVISGESGFAQISASTEATIAIYLVLDGGEEASTFEAEFELDSELVDCELDLGRVDPAAEPFGIGTWTSVFSVDDPPFYRVSLLRDNQSGTSLVADIVITSVGVPGMLELAFVEGEASGDIDEPPFFELVPIGTSDGAILAVVQIVPEPSATGLGLAALATLCALFRRQPRGV